MKRIFTIFLSVFLLVMVCKSATFAADIDLTMDCNTTPVSPGGSHAVTIGIDTKGLTVGGLGFTVTFNPNHLTPTGASAIGMAQGADNFQADSVDSGHYVIGILSLDGLTGTGDIVKIDFDVNPTLTPPLTTEVGISPGVDACDSTGFEQLSVGLPSGACTITIDSIDQVCIPDGDIAPLGNPDGLINVGDSLVALRFALDLEPGHPTAHELCHGDVAPLDVNNQPNPDGQITVGDALVILRVALGLVGQDTENIDNDGDGYTENQGDCNDNDSDINPGATEICTDNNDNDCDGNIDCEDTDCAGDSECSSFCLGHNTDDDGDGYTENQGDLDDSDSNVYPGSYPSTWDGLCSDMGCAKTYSVGYWKASWKCSTNCGIDTKMLPTYLHFKKEDNYTFFAGDELCDIDYNSPFLDRVSILTMSHYNPDGSLESSFFLIHNFESWSPYLNKYVSWSGIVGPDRIIDFLGFDIYSSDPDENENINPICECELTLTR